MTEKRAGTEVNRPVASLHADKRAVPAVTAVLKPEQALTAPPGLDVGVVQPGLALNVSGPFLFGCVGPPSFVAGILHREEGLNFCLRPLLPRVDCRAVVKTLLLVVPWKREGLAPSALEKRGRAG